MDVKTLLAAAPWLRRAWRVVPGPLRIPLLLIALVVWLVRRGGSEDTAPDSAGA